MQPHFKNLLHVTMSAWWLMLWIMTMLFTDTAFGVAVYDSRTEYYSHWMSLMSVYSNEEYYGFDIYEKKISQLILPGSHHSGMYEDAIRRKLQHSEDSYFSAIKYLNNTDKFVKWSIRQRSSIYNQLLAGKYKIPSHTIQKQINL